MLGTCGKCEEENCEVMRLRIPGERHMSVSEIAWWCGPCLELKMAQVTHELHMAAAQIASVTHQDASESPNASGQE